MGYLLARSRLFLLELGLDASRIRFRRHQRENQAHNASDYWDVDVNTTHGWSKCLGVADRGSFDLTALARRTGIPLHICDSVPPYEEEALVVHPNIPIIGQEYRNDSLPVVDTIKSLAQSALETHLCTLAKSHAMEVTLPSGNPVQLPSKHLSIKRETRTISNRQYTPCVVESPFSFSRLVTVFPNTVFFRVFQLIRTTSLVVEY